jgi:hypothetical protein
MFCGFACAEEAGSGHYLPGTSASFIDMLPDRGTSTFAYINAFTYYHGSTGASRDLQLGGQVAANVKGTVYADTSIFLYQAPVVSVNWWKSSWLQSSASEQLTILLPTRPPFVD